MPRGFVYVLLSPNNDYIKIGGTEKPLWERLRAINTTDPYTDLGPWQLSDFLYVSDWQLVEGSLHRHFGRSKSEMVRGLASSLRCHRIKRANN
jgi:hypothetical protein